MRYPGRFVLVAVLFGPILFAMACGSRPIKSGAELPTGQGVVFVRIVHEGSSVKLDFRKVGGTILLVGRISGVSEGDNVYALFLDPGRYELAAIGDTLGLWSDLLYHVCPAFSAQAARNNYIATIRLKASFGQYKFSCDNNENEFVSAQEMFSKSFPSLAERYAFRNAVSEYDQQNFYLFAATIFDKEEYIEVRQMCDKHDLKTHIDEALECLEEAARKNPESPEAQYLLGVAHVYADNLPETQKQYDILRNLSTNFTKLLLDVIAHVKPAMMEQIRY